MVAEISFLVRICPFKVIVTMPGTNKNSKDSILYISISSYIFHKILNMNPFETNH